MQRKLLIILVLVFAYTSLFGASIWQGLRSVNQAPVAEADICAKEPAACLTSEIPKKKKLKSEQKYDEKILVSSKGKFRRFSYDVATKGSIHASLNDFKAKANATLNDNRGWGKVASFTEVTSNGNFTLVLAEAKYLPSFSTICSSSWSCRTGRYVVINQDRWLGASAAWNGSGGSLRDYQHMVINHEVGHWLGHGHSSCGGVGQLAPVMQQQSINLQGCRFNPWPLSHELLSI